MGMPIRRLLNKAVGIEKIPFYKIKGYNILYNRKEKKVYIDIGCVT